MLYNQNWERKSNPVSDVLNRAADLLEKHGHIKFSLGNLERGMCANGAIYIAVDGDVNKYRESHGVLASYLGLNGSPEVAGWNNAKERTGQEVIDTMRAAAKIHEKETANAYARCMAESKLIKHLKTDAAELWNDEEAKNGKAVIAALRATAAK